MTISVAIKNFKGLRAAEFSCAPIALLSSINAQGKSSTAQAIAAALTGNAIEDDFEVKKSEITALIHDGAKTATVLITGEKGRSMMSYPEGRLVTDGEAPWASVYAAGLKSIADPKETLLKDRPKALAPYIKADPSREDLVRELGDEFTEETVESCWAAITRDGWDKTHEKAQERRTQARAAWEQITAESFGSAKVKTWRPNGWPDEMFAEIAIEQLEAKVAEARTSLESAIGNQAVDSAEVDRLHAIADDHEKRTVTVADEQATLKKLTDDMEALIEESARMPLPVLPPEKRGMPCPHCQALVSLQSDRGVMSLIKTPPVQEIDEKENKKRRLAKADMDGRLANANDKISTQRKILATAVARLEEAVGAQAQLELGAGSGDRVSADVVERARTAVVTAEADLRMAKQYAGATEAGERWQANDRFVTVLSAGPEGLRTKKMVEAVEAFNREHLAPLYKAAGWGPVSITEDFRITVVGPKGLRVYSLAADSDQMRARVVLQVAMARIDGSAMVVIDRAEALDSDNKKALVNLLLEAEMPAVICMVAGKPETVPDLANPKAKCGVTLWIEDGVARPLAEAMAQAA